MIRCMTEGDEYAAKLKAANIAVDHTAGPA
jgi:hypothetical protein